jgi:putative transcriptional regulator
MRLNLKLARLQKKLSQADLAKRVEISSQSISGYETGKANPGFETMKKIAEVLDSTVDNLFF